MAGGASGGEIMLEHTPTWIVASVCSIIVLMSLLFERLLHRLGKKLRKGHRKPPYEALLKVKEELMLLGFISLLLTVFQRTTQKICVRESLMHHLLPCPRNRTGATKTAHHITTAVFTGLVGRTRRLLAGGAASSDYCLNKGKVPILSVEAIHQLHIFIFVLAVTHVVLTAVTFILGITQIRKWRHWEDNIQQSGDNGPQMIRHVQQFKFIKNHFRGYGKLWKIFGWLRSFFKQFYGSVTEEDYTTLRLGFVMKHSRGHPKFNFYNYMNRALEGDFKKVVGISWYLWALLMIFLLLNVHGAKRYVPFEKLERVRVLDLQYHEHYLQFENPGWNPFVNVGFEALGNQHVMDICGLLRVRHLFGLEGRGISEIPTEIARLQHLETLHIRFTWITELPCEIGDLQLLKTLVVSRNTKLAELPSEIGDLQQLETLDLRYTRLTVLPPEIGNLQNLENLNLHVTMLKELPRETGKLQHLKTLEVGSAEITRLGSEIGDLQHLETLDLSDNRGLTQLPREMGKLQNLKWLLLDGTGVVRIPREIGGLKKLEILRLDPIIGALPWEAGELSKLKGVPECVRQVWKKGDLASSVLAGEMLSIQLVDGRNKTDGLIVGTKHMQIPRWIKDHFNDLGSLEIRMCKLEERDLKILREMPNLCDLTLRLEVILREPVAISGEGFPRLWKLIVDCRVPRVITFQEGAMPRLIALVFNFQFYGGPPADKDPPDLGIKHLGNLHIVDFRCNEEWYGGAAESSPCISAMIDVVRKEAQEHPREIIFHVSGRMWEEFPENKSTQAATISGTSKIDDTPNAGTGQIQGEEEVTFPANKSGKVSDSWTTGEIEEEEELEIH